MGRVILVVFPAEKTENLYPFAFQSKVNSLLLNLALATWRELPAPSISRRRSEDACEHSFVGSVCDFANNTPYPTPAHSRALFAEAEARAEKPRVACSSSRFQPAFVVAQQKIGCKFLFGYRLGPRRRARVTVAGPKAQCRRRPGPVGLGPMALH